MYILKRIDMTGQRFGKLIVVECVGFENKSSIWKCLCDCGNYTIASRKHLIQGHKKSCGCLNPKANVPMIDLTGKKFGHWTVLEKSSNVNDEVMWLCKCDCGTIKTVRGYYLRNGKSTSCGCNDGLSKVKRYLLKKWEEIKKDTDISNNYINFEKWAIANGYNEKKLLLRYETSKNYSLSNVFIGTYEEKKEILKKIRIEKEKNKVIKPKKISIDLSKDNIGKRYNCLTVLDIKYDKKKHSHMWLCKCDCGNEKWIRAYDVRNEIIISCGCRFTNHGLSNSKLYRTYFGMKARCYNKNSFSFKYYGGRGIKVCDEWLDNENGFWEFLNWSYLNDFNDFPVEEHRDTLSIDRIDPNGNYEPNNCRWVKLSINCVENKRPRTSSYNNSKKYDYRGNKYSMKELCKMSNLTYSSILYRMKTKKMTLEQAVDIPKSQGVEIKFVPKDKKVEN